LAAITAESRSGAPEIEQSQRRGLAIRRWSSTRRGNHQRLPGLLPREAWQAADGVRSPLEIMNSVDVECSHGKTVLSHPIIVNVPVGLRSVEDNEQFTDQGRVNSNERRHSYPIVRAKNDRWLLDNMKIGALIVKVRDFAAFTINAKANAILPRMMHLKREMTAASPAQHTSEAIYPSTENIVLEQSDIVAAVVRVVFAKHEDLLNVDTACPNSLLLDGASGSDSSGRMHADHRPT